MRFLKGGIMEPLTNTVIRWEKSVIVESIGQSEIIEKLPTETKPPFDFSEEKRRLKDLYEFKQLVLEMNRRMVSNSSKEGCRSKKHNNFICQPTI